MKFKIRLKIEQQKIFKIKKVFKCKERNLIFFRIKRFEEIKTSLSKNFNIKKFIYFNILNGPITSFCQNSTTRKTFFFSTDHDFNFYLFINNFETSFYFKHFIFNPNSLHVNKFNLFEKKKIKIFFVLPNQSFFLKSIAKIIFKLRFKFFIKEFQGRERNLKKLKYGKMIKPADRRSFISHGEEEIFSIGGYFKKNKIKFTKSFVLNQFVFITPISIRKYKNLSENIFFQIKICFIESLEILLMQNIENLFLVIKIIFQKSQKTRENLTYRNEIINKIIINTKFIVAEFLIIIENLSIKPIFYIRSFPDKRKFKSCFLKHFSILIFYSDLKSVLEIKKIKIFSKKVFPILKDNDKNLPMLFFTKNYYEFIILRNFFWKTSKNTGLDIILLSEYTKNSEVNKKLLKIGNKLGQIILITERFYFFNRFFISKISKVFFFSLPLNKEYIFEIYNVLNPFNTNTSIFILIRDCEYENISKIFEKSQFT
jgi:hypothetical protein